MRFNWLVRKAFRRYALQNKNRRLAFVIHHNCPYLRPCHRHIKQASLLAKQITVTVAHHEAKHGVVGNSRWETETTVVAVQQHHIVSLQAFRTMHGKKLHLTSANRIKKRIATTSLPKVFSQQIIVISVSSKQKHGLSQRNLRHNSLKSAHGISPTVFTKHNLCFCVR